MIYYKGNCWDQMLRNGESNRFYFDKLLLTMRLAQLKYQKEDKRLVGFTLSFTWGEGIA